MSTQNRRRFITNTAMTVAAAELGLIGLAKAQATQRLFGPIKQIDVGVLNIGYAEVGPTNGRPVILLHGWPYDIHSYAACRQSRSKVMRMGRRTRTPVRMPRNSQAPMRTE